MLDSRQTLITNNQPLSINPQFDQISKKKPSNFVIADLNVDPPDSDGEDCALLPPPRPICQEKSSSLLCKETDNNNTAEVGGDGTSSSKTTLNNNKLGKYKSRIKSELVDCGGSDHVDPDQQGGPSSREDKVTSLKTGLIHVSRKMPKNAHAHFILGLMYQRLGQPQKAVLAYEKAEEILLRTEEEIGRPELLLAVQIHHAQCLLLGSTGDYNSDKNLETDELEEIISKLKESVEADIRQVAVWNTLGLILLKTGRLESAISVLSSLLTVGSEDLDALANLGIAYLRSGNLELSTKCFEDLILKDQNHPAAIMNYTVLLLCKYGSVFAGVGANSGEGACTHQLEAANVAMECLTKAVQADPKSAHLWVNLANAYSLAGEHRNSGKCLEKVCLDLISYSYGQYRHDVFILKFLLNIPKLDIGPTLWQNKKCNQHENNLITERPTTSNMAFSETMSLHDYLLPGYFLPGLNGARHGSKFVNYASETGLMAVELEPSCMSSRYAVALHRIKDAEISQDPNGQLCWAGNEMASILKDGDHAIVEPRIVWTGLAMVHRAQHEIASSFEVGQKDLPEVEERALYTLKKAIEENPDDAVQWHQLGLHCLCTLQYKMSQMYLKAAIARLCTIGDGQLVGFRSFTFLGTHDVHFKVPEFDGKSNVDAFIDWLDKVERVFSYKKYGDPKQCSTCKVYIGLPLHHRVVEDAERAEREVYPYELRQAHARLLEAEQQRVGRYKSGLTKKLEEAIALQPVFCLAEIVQLAKQASELHAQYRLPVSAPTTAALAIPVVTAPRTFVLGNCYGYKKPGHEKRDCPTFAKKVGFVDDGMRESVITTIHGAVHLIEIVTFGISLQLSEDPSQAEEVYRRALSLATPGQAHTTFSNLGNLYRQQKRFDRAKAMIAKSLELNPGYAPAHNNLGLVFVAEGRWEDANNCFEKALKSDPLLDASKSNIMKTSAMCRVHAALSSSLLGE
ncbi:hypothetical protein GIB67_004485 [Kingdonia uniflora]|uniref:UDP-N-acetylglucosamine--peptide N-acetylglucosaminyltransferase SPINDLY n=1 Tax=Kingdonia uniflora TaxID=39325 RepID=A0A7J7MRU3_9MAGN|nr:hypothetical protein GIB67_004485 [Kingdonia uniflora]